MSNIDSQKAESASNLASTLNLGADEPEYSYGVTCTPDGEFAVEVVLWRKGEKFLSATAESEPAALAEQESQFAAMAHALNALNFSESARA